ncbi:hypothetical protein FOA52_014330 [Chlamydomonas sp. UWO 241]|nr:hypothetical protein FOA52_014330 [Chlamydomonas sp. UWO 241]
MQGEGAIQVPHAELSAAPQTDTSSAEPPPTSQVDADGLSKQADAHAEENAALKAELFNLKQELIFLHQATQQRHAAGASMHSAPRDGGSDERFAMRLQKAEHALEQERLQNAQLRRQLEWARQQQQQQQQAVGAHASGSGTAAPVGSDSPAVPPSPGNDPSSGPLAGRLGAASSPPGAPPGGLLTPTISMRSDMEQLQQELQVLQTQLLQRSVEAERSKRAAAEADAVAKGLREQVEGLSTKGTRTLEEERQLERRCAQLEADNARLRSQEHAFRVEAAGASDRASASEQVSLDFRRQCEAAAGTISRLIDENNEVVAAFNGMSTRASGLGEELTRAQVVARALEALAASGLGGRAGRAQSGAGAGGGGDVEAGSEQLELLRSELSAAVEAAVRSVPGAAAAHGTQQQQQQQPQPTQQPSARHTWQLRKPGAGVPTHLPPTTSGVLDDEWKLRALEEEVAGAEAQLARGRAATGANAGANPHPHAAALARSAKHARLPLGLRIQAMAQTLAELEGEIEAERRAREAEERAWQVQLAQAAAAHQNDGAPVAPPTAHIPAPGVAPVTPDAVPATPVPGISPTASDRRVVSVFERQPSLADAFGKQPAALPVAGVACELQPFVDVSPHGLGAVQPGSIAPAQPTLEAPTESLAQKLALLGGAAVGGQAAIVQDNEEALLEDLIVVPRKRQGGGMWGWVTGADATYS